MRRIRLNRCLPAAALVLLLSADIPSAKAQAQSDVLGSFGRVEETNTNINSYYYYGKPGAPTVQVYVYGTVRAPGVYELEVGTDLNKLLALTGGPVLSTRQKNNRRQITLQLMRPTEGREAPVYEAELGSVLRHEAQYPILQDGDVLMVETVEHQRFAWRDALSIVGASASIILVVSRLVLRTGY